MTATAPTTEPTVTPETSTWDAEFQRLKARFPHVKDTILFCLHLLQMDEDIAIDDAKARADLAGLRITAASMNAARRLLAPQPETASATAPTSAVVRPAPQPARVRQPRAQPKAIDAEALLRGVLGKIQEQGSAEADRLRDAIRKAIAVLQGGLDS